jgi:hypothetical protein
MEGILGSRFDVNTVITNGSKSYGTGSHNGAINKPSVCAALPLLILFKHLKNIL